MFQLTRREVVELRILCLLPIIIGCSMMFFGTDAVPLQQFIATGDQQLSIRLDQALGTVGRVEQTGSDAADHIIINEASREQLLACPGIGSKTAELIMTERRFAPFADWRDFDDRVKNIGPAKIQTMKEAGVRISRDEK